MYYNKQTSKFEKFTFSISRGYWVVLSGIAIVALLVAIFTAIWAYVPATAEKVKTPSTPPQISISADEINSLIPQNFGSTASEPEPEPEPETELNEESVPDQQSSILREETRLDSQYISLLSQFEKSIGQSAWDELIRSDLEITFYRFYTENNYDQLKIYDGPSTGFKEIANLTGGSLTLPLTYRSTNSYGSLTFSFHSDASNEYSGWEAIARTVSNNTTPEPSYNMRRGTRKVGSVTYRDPGGTGNYNSKSDVVETLTAKSSSSAIPARLGYLFNSLGIENNIVSQKALIESLIQTLEVYEQPHRGELLNSYLDVPSLGIKDFTSTLRLMKDNIKAIQYDDPVSMTKGWLNWLVEDNGSPDFILFTTDFIPLFDPDSQNAVLKVVLGAFFNDFDENLARLTYASNEYKKIQKDIDSSSATEPLRYTYLMFLEKEKARQERIEADRHEFEIASQLAEEERVESQVEKNSFKFTSLMVIGGAISVIALFGLILLLFAILRTLKHIHSSLNQNESISTQPEDAETILNA
jgi:hypothetical protein